MYNSSGESDFSMKVTSSKRYCITCKFSNHQLSPHFYNPKTVIFRGKPVFIAYKTREI